MKAVQRLHTSSGVISTAAKQAPAPRGAEYQALLLMYRVSELLAASSDLPDFLGQLADMVLEEVRADTVVLLQADERGELRPQIIRHRGTLTPGEVPVSRGIVERVVKDRVAVMSNDVGHDERIKSGQSVMLYKIRAVVALPLTVRGELRGVLYLSRSGLQNFSTGDVELMSGLAALVASGLERAELKERVAKERENRRALERFHPPEVIERLGNREAGEESLEEHQATVLVCELCDFAALVSRVPPRQLANLLHEYYELLYEKVFANGGSLVKLHDGWALALFGAPHSPDRDAVWAVQTARDLCQEFTSVAMLWPGSQALQLRCALDTGTVVAGVLGSAERVEFVAIGEPIAVASGLVQQQAGTGVCLTERTFRELPQARYRVEPVPALDNLRVFRLL
jgi:class 3 adenylate cyclase